ncbi:MAG: hypothetical protein AAF787_18110 [Chloroflexota bacterium]
MYRTVFSPLLWAAVIFAIAACTTYEKPIGVHQTAIISTGSGYAISVSGMDGGCPAPIDVRVTENNHTGNVKIEVFTVRERFTDNSCDLGLLFEDDIALPAGFDPAKNTVTVNGSLVP